MIQQQCIRTKPVDKPKKNANRKTPQQLYERHNAHMALNRAVRNGVLPPVKIWECMTCKDQAAVYHHWQGYGPQEQLEVVPLCRPCHGVIHRLLGISCEFCCENWPETPKFVPRLWNRTQLTIPLTGYPHSPDGVKSHMDKQLERYAERYSLTHKR